MSRPTVEVADILRAQGNRFLDRYERTFDFPQLKALRAIERCRTAALGGHIDTCPRCGFEAAISNNSCRNRHCPKCQTQARERWLAARQGEFLPTRYFHVVFTVPHELNVLASHNQRRFYDLLFTASAKAALEIAADPKHLGAEIGLISVLRRLHRKDWVVYAKPAFDGPLQVLTYLGRYTHRVAISNQGLLAFDGEHVTFRWKDYAHGGKQRKMTLEATEFLRRFFLHVLPKGFVRIRHFGFLANRCRSQTLALANELLASDRPPPYPPLRLAPTGTALVVEPP